MLRSPRERFTGTAERYQQHRPSYPSELIDWILAPAPPGRLADIGCGTGISTRLFADRGRDVVGIDPNDDMLSEARRAGGTYLKGESTATGLPDRSVALAVAAQAFHWFDVVPTLREWKRILVPGGRACAFWNLRAESPFMREYDDLLQAFTKEYKEVPKAPGTIAAIKREVGTFEEAEFPNRQRLDRDGFFGRVYSSSYVAVGLKNREEFDRRLDDLFARNQTSGVVVFPYQSVAVAWTFDAPRSKAR